VQKKKRKGGNFESLGHVYLIHAANWPHVKNKRGQLIGCAKYTRQIGRVCKIHAATCFSQTICHVVIKTRG